MSILSFVELCSSRPLVVNIQPEIKRRKDAGLITEAHSRSFVLAEVRDQQLSHQDMPVSRVESNCRWS